MRLSFSRSAGEGRGAPPVIPVTCTLIAMNEADRIARAIESVRGLVDEVVVVDCGSTDGTQALCESLGARVVHNDWVGFGPQKRFAEDCARNDVILNLDADEWLTDALREEIRAILSAPQMSAKTYKMRMTMVFPHDDAPRPFAHFHNYVRLYDRRVARFSNSLVHDEVPPTPDAVQLRAPAYHRSFRSLAALARKEISYFELQKQEKRKSRAVLLARLPLEFPLQFLKYYLLRRYIFGGLYGFAAAMTTAFMRFLRLVILLGW